jgi:hypothetical protein
MDHGMKAPIVIIAALLAGSAAATELHDPMRPPQVASRAGAHAVARPGVPHLSAIFVRNDRAGAVRKAILDGRWVRPGDEVAGGRVESISRDTVRWVRRGKPHDLHLPGRSNELSHSFKKVTADPPRAGNGVPEHAP